MRRDKRSQEPVSFIAQSCGRISSSKRKRPWQLFLPANTAFSATPGCVSPRCRVRCEKIMEAFPTFVFLRRFIISPTIRSPQPLISKKGWFPPPFYPLLFFIFPRISESTFFEFSVFSRLFTSGEIHSTQEVLYETTPTMLRPTMVKEHIFLYGKHFFFNTSCSSTHDVFATSRETENAFVSIGRA